MDNGTIQGPQGPSGPNEVTTDTATDIVGLLKGNGGQCIGGGGRGRLCHGRNRGFGRIGVYRVLGQVRRRDDDLLQTDYYYAERADGDGGLLSQRLYFAW